jgi:hypothetical protein
MVYHYILILCRDGAVGIATRYCMDGSRFEPPSRRDFQHPSGLCLGKPRLLLKGYQIFPGVKAAGEWR